MIFMFSKLCVAYTPPYTHQRYINEDKNVPNTDNFVIFTILYFYSFILLIDTSVQNNDNEISLYFRPVTFIFFKLQCISSSNSIIYLWPDNGLVIEAETCCHLVTFNKINIHNTKLCFDLWIFTPYLYTSNTRMNHLKTCTSNEQRRGPAQAMMAAPKVQVDSSLTSAPDGNGQFHAPPALASSDHQNRKMGGPQSRSGHSQEKSLFLGSNPGSLTRYASSLYWLSYAGSYLYVKSPMKQMLISKKTEQNS
jgi:hypothetical protein